MDFNALEKYLSSFQPQEPPDALKTKVIANAKAVWTRRPPSLLSVMLNYSLESYVYVLAIVLFISFVCTRADYVLTVKLFYDIAQENKVKQEDPEEKMLKKMFADAGLDYKAYAMRVKFTRELKEVEEESKTPPPNFYLSQKQLKEGLTLINVDDNNGL